MNGYHKAVNPARIMGASKRAAALIVHEAARSTGKPFVAVGFGNVLGSRGRVVLTVKPQIAAGGQARTEFYEVLPSPTPAILKRAKSAFYSAVKLRIALARISAG